MSELLSNIESEIPGIQESISIFAGKILDIIIWEKGGPEETIKRKKIEINQSTSILSTQLIENINGVDIKEISNRILKSGGKGIRDIYYEISDLIGNISENEFIRTIKGYLKIKELEKLGFIDNVGEIKIIGKILKGELNYNSLILLYKDEIINYQTSKGLILSKNDGGAGNILGPRTSENIKLSIYLKEYDFEKKGIISKKLYKEEKREDFLLGEFLRDYGLPESTYKIALNIIYKSIEGKNSQEKINFISKNIDVLITNLTLILRYILSIESPKKGKYDTIEGGHIYAKNTDWAGIKGSSAKSSFQYLDGSIAGKRKKMYDRKKGEYTSFEVALRQNKKFYKKQGEEIPEYIKIAYNNPGIVSPLDISSEQMLNVFLIDIYYKKGFNELFNLTLLEGNAWGMKTLYARLHHTNPDTNTKILMKEKLKYFGPQLIKIV